MEDQSIYEALSTLELHYSVLARKYGDSPKASQWRDRETQEKRMKILAEIGDLSSAKILDFGCGTGNLLELLRREFKFQGEYIGYDISEEMLHICRKKYPQVRFERRNILTQGVPEDFDYIIVSGVFNNRIQDNWRFVTQTLELLFGHTKYGLSFNLLSTYVDFMESDLFYASPEEILSFCKQQLSDNVALRHDYYVREGTKPYEFSVYVYRTAN